MTSLFPILARPEQRRHFLLALAAFTVAAAPLRADSGSGSGGDDDDDDDDDDDSGRDADEDRARAERDAARDRERAERDAARAAEAAAERDGSLTGNGGPASGIGGGGGTLRDIAIRHPDGWVEMIVAGDYILLDDLGRRVIRRRATAEDAARLAAMIR